MKFLKLYKSMVIIAIAILFISDVVYGQTIKDTQPKIISIKPECIMAEGDHIFTKVEVLADFKGSAENWFEYVQKNFDFNLVVHNLPAIVQHFEDSIFVKFIVTREGNICNIEILKGNEILADPIIKLLKLSPKWRPGSSSGRSLNTYRTLKIDVLFDKEKSEFKIIRNFNSYYKTGT